MGEFAFQCPTVPVIRGSEVRFSVDESKITPIKDWPLRLVTCSEIIPDQPRRQWGVMTQGDRLDSFKGFTLGNERNNFSLGLRTTDSNGPMSALENQKVGVASLTLGGRFHFRYWNDHAFWWWPMVGKGSDQGDTAGVHFSYNLAHHDITVRGWKASRFNVTLRLATGKPDPTSVQKTSEGTIYSRVEFDEVQRGDIAVSADWYKGRTKRLEVGFLVDSSVVSDGTQNKITHRTLGIPELPKRDGFEVMVFGRLTY